MAQNSLATELNADEQRWQIGVLGVIEINGSLVIIDLLGFGNSHHVGRVRDTEAGMDVKEGLDMLMMVVVKWAGPRAAESHLKHGCAHLT